LRTAGFFLGFVIFIMVLVYALPAFAQEGKVTKKNVPAAVIAAFEKSFPTTKVNGYSRETEDGKVSYEIDCMVGTVHHDVSYYADGSLVVDEERIKIKDLPEVVMKAIQAAYPKGVIKSAEKLTTGSGVGYEVIVKSGRNTFEVELDVAGKVVNTEKMGKSEKD
jgi:hypothetical protein